MATGTISSHSRLMDIGMTLVAFFFCIFKDKSQMTLPAVDYLVLPYKRHIGFVVVKRVNTFIKLPSFRAMTGLATDLKSRAMR
jgi:hypothetical protein